MTTMDSMPPEASAVPGESAPKKKRWPLAVVSMLLLGALGGGVYWGTTIPDPTESQEYLDLLETHLAVAEDRDQLNADFTEMKSGIEQRENDLEQQGKDLDSRSSNLDEREEDLAEAESAVADREKAVGKIEDEQEKNSVSDGVWTVGADIKAGTYRAKEAVGSTCYWAVLKSGTNGDHIINNGIPSGGRPTVSVRKGQDFESVRCGTWIKQ